QGDAELVAVSGEIRHGKVLWASLDERRAVRTDERLGAAAVANGIFDADHSGTQTSQQHRRKRSGKGDGHIQDGEVFEWAAWAVVRNCHCNSEKNESRMSRISGSSLTRGTAR